MKSKSLSHALDLIVPKVNEKAPALLSNLTQNVIKPLNLPKLIDPSGQGIALPIPSPWNTVVDAWIDNPLAGAIDSVLGPVLKAVGLKAAIHKQFEDKRRHWFGIGQNYRTLDYSAKRSEIGSRGSQRHGYKSDTQRFA
jgi:hypothetical protein